MPVDKALHSSHVARQLQAQTALGRFVTHVEIDPAPGLPEGLSLHAGPKTVLVGPHGRLPWQLCDAGLLDHALRALHGQILEEAQMLAELLAPCEGAAPEVPAPRPVQRRLRRMLGLRSLLELAATWQDAPVPGWATPGWTSGPRRPLGLTLPWHQSWQSIQASDVWHLHDLRRWHWPRTEPGSWAETTARRLTCVALLQDADPRQNALLARPLAHDPQVRRQQREDVRRGKRNHQNVAPPAPDLDPGAFSRRVRLALSAVLEPALLGFDQNEVLRAVQGARGGRVALLRLLPGVAPGPATALGATLREELAHGGHLSPGEGARPAHAAGPESVRRSCWTAGRAGDAKPVLCLAAEAAAGPLHLLIPGLHQASPAHPLLRDGGLSTVLEEVGDLFSAVAALPAEQDLPLPDLSGLLSGSGQLRLGAQAAGTEEPLRAPAEPVGNADEMAWHRRRQAALAAVPGLTRAIEALRGVTQARERARARLKTEACQVAGIGELDFDEAVSGERAFDLDPEDRALERSLTWAGGTWSLQLARHPQDLVSDGKALSNCVGWGGYAQTVRAGRSRIIRVLAQDDDQAVPILTLELKPARQQDGPTRWQLYQARGLRNRLPSGLEAALLALWAREVGVRHSTLR